MTSDSNTTSTENANDRPRKHRPQGKRALGIVDRRSLAWRRRCEFFGILEYALGGKDVLAADPILAGKVAELAEMKTLAEQARLRQMSGDTSVTLDDIVRLARLADIAERRVLADRKTTKTGPDLASYLAEKAKQAA